MMSKRNYVIGVREPIGGDRSLRRYRNTSDEYPLPVVRRDGVGKSSEKKRSMAKRKEAIVTVTILVGDSAILAIFLQELDRHEWYSSSPLVAELVL